MSLVCSIQGVGTILGLQQCNDITEHFHGLSLKHYSWLFQALPANLRQELKDMLEFMELNNSIHQLGREIQEAASEEVHQRLEDQQHLLYLQKQKLKAQACSARNALVMRVRVPLSA
jgi:hypothetical protein